MILVNCKQGSPEWFAARAGRATSSEFASILAKGQGKTRASYLRKVASERLTGQHFDNGFKGFALDRGHELEPIARNEYEATRGVIVDQVGLALHDDFLVSCSPDGLVGEEGGIEIKSVYPTTQLDTILAGGFPSEHRAQIQGNLWITGRKWWDFISYCPEMPNHLQLYVFRVVPDPAYITTLAEEVRVFLAEVDQLLGRLPKAPAPLVDPNHDDRIIRTDEELAALISGFSQHDA